MVGLLIMLGIIIVLWVVYRFTYKARKEKESSIRRRSGSWRDGGTGAVGRAKRRFKICAKHKILNCSACQQEKDEEE